MGNPLADAAKAAGEQSAKEAAAGFVKEVDHLVMKNLMKDGQLAGLTTTATPNQTHEQVAARPLGDMSRGGPSEGIA